MSVPPATCVTTPAASRAAATDALAEPTKAEPCVIVIFGASGDLTARKLIPALYELHCTDALPAGTTVLGLSRREKSDALWRNELEPWAREHANCFDAARWEQFAGRVHYLAADATRADAYPKLRSRIDDLASRGEHPGNVLLYLSVAPQLYEPVIERLGASDITAEGRRWCSVNRAATPWQRIIIEKPFGSDLDTAASLNRALGRVFEEDSIFRIDHYLGKELVQNLLAMRFANTIFEPVWNHRYIDHVQISATETLGVGDRASYYESAGAMRDMIQSHLLQVLALVAMEPPTNMTAHHIRQEKIKVFDAIERPRGELSNHVCFGQYGGDAARGIRAYRAEANVAADSLTDTFAAMRVQFNNWRWAGTPFYLRSGKRLAGKCTEIVVQFKQPPASLFRTSEPFVRGQMLAPNRIRIEVAPRPNMTLRFAAKVPGSMRLDIAEMDFDLARHFGQEPAEAYGPLLADAMRGDQTLYPHRMEVEGTWRAVMPFLDTPAQSLREGIAGNYAPDSWGPACADELLAREGRSWHNTGG